MNTSELFFSIGEPYAAGLFEHEGDAPIIRYSNALKRFFECAELVPYEEGMLYPQGICIFNFDASLAVKPNCANTFDINYSLLQKKSQEAYEIVKKEDELVVKFSDSPHTVGGMGWTHAFPNYSRILCEGLSSYERRVDALDEGDFRRGMKILLEGIRISKKHLPSVLKPLVSAFFDKGGMQLQISCLSRAEILDAMAHPENYKSLIVRVGGFSEYFTRLDPAMQKTILERTEH